MTDDDEPPPFHGAVIVGDVSAEQFAARLSRRLGQLSDLRLVSLDAAPMPIARWEATDAGGQVVSGEVALQHVVDGERIVVWVEAGAAD